MFQWEKSHMNDERNCIRTVLWLIIKAFLIPLSYFEKYFHEWEWVYVCVFRSTTLLGNIINSFSLIEQNPQVYPDFSLKRHMDIRFSQRN